MQIDHPMPGEACTELGADQPRKPLHLRLLHRALAHVNAMSTPSVWIYSWTLGVAAIGVPGGVLLALWLR